MYPEAKAQYQEAAEKAASARAEAGKAAAYSRAVEDAGLKVEAEEASAAAAAAAAAAGTDVDAAFVAAEEVAELAADARANDEGPHLRVARWVVRAGRTALAAAAAAAGVSAIAVNEMENVSCVC